MLGTHGTCGANLRHRHRAACWEPSVVTRVSLRHLGTVTGLHAGNLLQLWGQLEASWDRHGAACSEPTVATRVNLRHLGTVTGLHVGNLRLVWGQLEAS